MTATFYPGQQDYITQLNALAAGGMIYQGLSITKTGNFAYPLQVPRAPVYGLDDLAGNVTQSLTVKAAGNVAYDEGISRVGPISNLSAVTFNDLASAWVVQFSNIGSLTALAFPTLQYIVSPVASPNNIVNNPLLASIDFSALVRCVGVITIQSSPLLTSLSFPLLTRVGGLGLASLGLTSFSAPNLAVSTAALSLTSTPLTTYSLPALTVVMGNIVFSGTMTSLTTINLPALQSLNGLLSMANTMSSLSTVTLTSLTALGGISMTATNATMTTMALPALVEFGVQNVSITGFSALANFSVGSTLKICSGNFVITGAALTQASVDGILARLAALDGTNGTTAYSSKTVTLTGGTSSTPSAAGLVSKATLVGRGCTVTHN